MPRNLPDMTKTCLTSWQKSLCRVLVEAYYDHLDKVPYKTASGIRLIVASSTEHRRMLTAVYRAYRDHLKAKGPDP